MYAAQIQTGELRPQDLPTTYGDWSDYARFAVTFAPRDREGCREFATSAFARWRRTGEVPRTLQELRACLWFEPPRALASAELSATKSHSTASDSHFVSRRRAPPTSTVTRRREASSARAARGG